MKGVLVDAPTRVGAVGRLDMHTTGLIVTWRGPDEVACCEANRQTKTWFVN